MDQLSANDAAAPLRGARVLVVEDDIILAIDLEATLTEAGAEVAGFGHTVREALELVNGGQITAALLDIRLGRETVEPVARKLADGHIPFVFYSAQVDIDPIRKEWPCCKVISKPARPKTIIMAIAEAVKEHGAAL
jgi:DNA-binding NtrC family response regulator